MIHYTLLPEKEIKTLKREYRLRLFIFFFFFMSCAVLVGIASIIPAFLLSFSQEKDALNHVKAIEKSRKEKGIDSIVKELSGGSVILKKLNDNSNGRIYSKMIFQIINDKPNGLTINSFDIASTKNATSSIVVVIQGKAPTRELLVNFKDKLESDPLVTKVELPVSDLAKNKDISYSMKVSLIGIYENKF